MLARDGATVCELVHVFADPVTQTSRRVPDLVRGMFQSFEAGAQLGFTPSAEPFGEAGVPHAEMTRTLQAT